MLQTQLCVTISHEHIVIDRTATGSRDANSPSLFFDPLKENVSNENFQFDQSITKLKDEDMEAGPLLA